MSDRWIPPVPRELAEKWDRERYAIACRITVPAETRQARERMADALAFQLREAERMSHPLWWPTTEVEQICAADAAQQTRLAIEQAWKGRIKVLPALCPICHHYHGPEPGACWADVEEP